jgi:hypothetical protein
MLVGRECVVGVEVDESGRFASLFQEAQRERGEEYAKRKKKKRKKKKQVLTRLVVGADGSVLRLRGDGWLGERSAETQTRQQRRLGRKKHTQTLRPRQARTETRVLGKSLCANVLRRRGRVRTQGFLR